MVRRRLLITGSRQYTDRSMVEGAIRTYSLPDATTIVHGAARGADTLAAEVARSLGIPVEAHPADWSTYGRSAGIRRNEYMVSLGAYCVLAFPTPSSVGTWDCIRRAAASGLIVHVYPQV